MDLPKVLVALINAQNNFDSLKYADCFDENALVFDEGKTHKGKAEIQNWIQSANEKYKAVMKPVKLAKTASGNLLTAEISGTFDGSPIILSYYFEIDNGLIQSLKIN